MVSDSVSPRRSPEFDATTAAPVSPKLNEDAWSSVASGVGKGFTDRAHEAWDNKGATAVGIGASTLLAQAFAYTRNNPELVGFAGRAFGKWGPGALLALGVGELARRMFTAPDTQSASEVAGGFLFDTVLGGAVGGMTYKAVNTSPFNRFHGPQAVSEVPAGMKFRINGDTAQVDMGWRPTALQVRLANGKGFEVPAASSADVIPLKAMPAQLADGTTLAYKPTFTEVVKPDGKSFRQYLDNSVEYRVGDLTMRRYPGGAIRTTDDTGTTTLYRETGTWSRNAPKGDSVDFDVSSGVTRLTTDSGWNYRWNDETFAGMRSQLGRHVISTRPDGDLKYVYTRGTDRWLRMNRPATELESTLPAPQPGPFNLMLRDGRQLNLTRPVIEPPPAWDAAIKPVSI